MNGANFKGWTQKSGNWGHYFVKLIVLIQELFLEYLDGRWNAISFTKYGLGSDSTATQMD